MPPRGKKSPKPARLQMRGLTNSDGDNHCFLNVLVQTLFHLEDFRVMFQSIDWVSASDDSTFYALKALFAQLASTSVGSQAPDQLRSALAKAYETEGKLKIKDMEDVTEAFEKLLIQINKNVNKNWQTAKLSFPYHLFSMETVIHGTCRCGFLSAPVASTVNVLHASVDELTAGGKRFGSTSLGSTLKNAVFAANMITCLVPTCHETTKAKTALKQAPPVLSISLDWSTMNPKIEEIKSCLRIIKTELDLREAFTNLDEPYPYSLVSMIVYYGHHYAAFIRDAGTEMWIYYDDELVKSIGSNWDSVLTQCEQGKWQPHLLMYSRLGDTFQPSSSSFPSANDANEWRLAGGTEDDDTYQVLQLPLTPHPTGVLSPKSPLRYTVMDEGGGRTDSVYEYDARFSPDYNTNLFGSSASSGASDFHNILQNIGSMNMNPPSNGVTSPPTYDNPTNSTVRTQSNVQSTLDTVQSLTQAAKNHEMHINYLGAKQCYEAAADAMMDMIENSSHWPRGIEDPSRQKAVVTAHRYLELASMMHRLVSGPSPPF